MKVRINGLNFDTGESRVGIMGVEQEPQVIRDIGEQRRRFLQNATRYIYNVHRRRVSREHLATCIRC